MESSHTPLHKLTSRSLPDLSCPHDHDDSHEEDGQPESSDSPSSAKKLHQQHQIQPNFIRDHPHKLSLLSSSQFRPFFHSSSSSLSSDSCLSHSLPHPHCSNTSAGGHQKETSGSGKAPSEEDYESLKLISNGAYGYVSHVSQCLAHLSDGSQFPPS